MNTYVDSFKFNGNIVGSPVSCAGSALDETWRRDGYIPHARAIITAAYPQGVHRTASVAGSILGGSTCPVSTWPENRI